MARDIRTSADEAVAALNASDFSGKLAPDTYITTRLVGNWTPLGLAEPRPKYTGGTFEKTGTNTELVALREAAANLADDHSVKFVGLETRSRLLGVDGPLLTIKREKAGKIVTDRYSLAQDGQSLNGSERLVKRVLAGIPAATVRRA